jgi:hypothetical protein
MADLNELAERGAKFWGEQLDIAELMGNPQHQEHAFRRYLSEAKWLADIEVARFKAQKHFRPDIAECDRTYFAWEAAGVALGEAGGHEGAQCFCNLRSGAKCWAADIRKKTDAEVAEYLTHQIANFTRARFEDNLVKERAARIANKKADAAGIVYVTRRRKPQEVHL